MQNTWASGAIELLDHADKHIFGNSAFDKRIAYISIDCAIETSFRIFISLPFQKSAIKIPYKEIEEAGTSFSKIKALAYRYASKQLSGVDESDIEYYHRIRNQLYHNGTGFSVDENSLTAYRQIANIILHNLFFISMPEPNEKETLENLLNLWNVIQTKIKAKLEDHNVDEKDIFKWEVAEKYEVLTPLLIEKTSELRYLRNLIIHEGNKDKDKMLKHGYELAKQIINELNGTY